MTKTLMVLALSLAASSAFAAGEHGDSHADTANAEVDRTIALNAGDMWFDPETLDIEPGKTVKFTVTNTGDLKHEFVIGDTQAQQEHRDMMQAMMGNGHDGSGNSGGGHGGGGHGDHGDGMPSVTIKPGETAELVWTAPEDMQSLEYACNIPGHYEAGMSGRINAQG